MPPGTTECPRCSRPGDLPKERVGESTLGAHLVWAGPPPVLVGVGTEGGAQPRSAVSGQEEEEVVADQLRSDISSLARADVNTSSNDGAPGAAVATAVAELVANIRGKAETEARAVESSLCEAPATANPPEVAPTRKARKPKRRRRNRRRRRRQQQAGGDGDRHCSPFSR